MPPPPPLSVPSALGERKRQHGQAKVRALLLNNKTMDLCQLPIVALTKRGLGCYRRTWCIPSADLSTTLQAMDNRVRQLDAGGGNYPWQPALNTGRFVVETRCCTFYDVMEDGQLRQLSSLHAKSLRGRRVVFHVRPVVAYATWRGVRWSGLRFFAHAAVVLPDSDKNKNKRCRQQHLNADDFGEWGRVTKRPRGVV